MERRLQVLAVVLLLSGSLLAEGRYDEWFAGLGAEDLGARERAHAALVRAGTPALEDLRRASDASKDEDLRNRIAAIVKEIRKREPHGLQFGGGMPKMRLTLDLVNGKGFQYSLRVRNRGPATVVLWPYLSLRVLDAQGNEIKPNQRRGRHGRRRGGCYLKDVPFVQLAPGKSWSFQESLAQYMHDPDFITGWQLPAEGDYALELTYVFDRAAAKKRCSSKWKLLNDPEQPWNQALALKHTFRIEMRVQAPR